MCNERSWASNRKRDTRKLSRRVPSKCAPRNGSFSSPFTNDVAVKRSYFDTCFLRAITPKCCQFLTLSSLLAMTTPVGRCSGFRGRFLGLVVRGGNRTPGERLPESGRGNHPSRPRGEGQCFNRETVVTLAFRLYIQSHANFISK
jgi:hypothetical protein